MKKILMAVVAALVFAAAAFAQSEQATGETITQVDVTDATTKIHFPAEFQFGKWKDAKWNAVWEISSNNSSFKSTVVDITYLVDSAILIGEDYTANLKA